MLDASGSGVVVSVGAMSSSGSGGVTVSAEAALAMLDAFVLGHKATVETVDGQRVTLKMRVCASCHAGYGDNGSFPDGGKQCGRCKTVYYCNRSCQKKHWAVHKTTCASSQTDKGEKGDE